LWEGREARKIWRACNEFIVSTLQSNNRVLDKVFRIGDVGMVSKVKISIIEEMIQVE
jgi:aspartate aminotransferase-like enzyme